MPPAPETPQQSLQLQQKVQNWQLLHGRLTAAQWISMREPEVVREITDLESEPLFRRMAFGVRGQNPVLRRRRWPASSLHSGFFELKEWSAPSGGSSDIQAVLDKHKDLVRLLRRIGREAFERYFLYGEEGRPLADICEELGISEEQGRRILDLLLEVGAQSEFFRPGRPPDEAGLRYYCIASIEQDPCEGDNLYFRFLSPHWARGRYVVDYDRLEGWKRENVLSSPEKRHLRQVLKKIELINMRQDILFQILSRVTTEQSAYLRTRLGHRCRPLSLREVARRIGVAPSTVSRAVGNRSALTPWGEDIPLKSLMTSQRSVILAVLSDWRERGELGDSVTDERLMRRLASEAGVTVSRRTVNECRRKLKRGAAKP